jgi:hypothetical protein
LRPGLAKRRRWRVSHVLRQVAGTDEEHVDPSTASRSSMLPIASSVSTIETTNRFS